MITIVLICWMMFWNILAFVLYGLDKYKAKRKQWRIPEKVLLGAAFASGAFGAFLGMRFFHHKTKHLWFVVGVPVACVLWFVVLLYVLMHFA